MSDGVQLRPIRDEDAVFLLRVYASTREEELAMVDWDAAQKDAFLRMQFNAQHQHYQAHFPHARFDIIERDGQGVGRLYVDRRPDDIRVIDIALLPEHRNHGIGALLMTELLNEGLRDSKTVSIHVERNNRALTFYERLGFRFVQDEGVYFLLEKPLAVNP